MTNVELNFVPPNDPDTSEEIQDLMDSANKKMRWARKQAEKFLDHANYLEVRANNFRKLAYDMAMEAQAYNDEMADLLEADFPLELVEIEEESDVR
jgi:hypothetical protein